MSVARRCVAMSEAVGRGQVTAVYALLHFLNIERSCGITSDTARSTRCNWNSRAEDLKREEEEVVRA